MVNILEVLETNRMIQDDNLDVRTITMGISLLDCASADVGETCDRIRAKVMRLAGRLVSVGEEIARDFGIPIVNKRVSVTPISLVGSSCCRTEGDFARIAKTLDETAASKPTGRKPRAAKPAATPRISAAVLPFSSSCTLRSESETLHMG